MPRVDFKPDVDGFAFKNDWTFDANEKEEIKQIVQNALPAAAALLAPIVMAASPMIVPVAGIALGPVLPLIALAGPFLFLAAPKISELIVNAIADKIAKGTREGDLCGGMTAAALDYHRLRWLPPRGNSVTDNPVFDPHHSTTLQSQLRRRIWNGQLESHIDNTPTVVLWKVVATIFGDWGNDWLRDRTREELAKISAELSAGLAVPIGMPWKGKFNGHIVVGYALDWHGVDKCSLTVYDNERPGVEVIFDIDLTQSPAIIFDRHEPDRVCDGIFLGTFRQKTPPPAVVLSTPLALSASGFSVRGEPLDATFSISNQGFGDVPDAAAGLRSAGSVAAPPMAWQLPMIPDPSVAPPMPIPLIPDFSPIPLATDQPVDADARSLPEGAHLLEPIVMAGSAIAGIRLPRILPNADGSAAAVVSHRVNPRLTIRRRGVHSTFGCQRLLVEGEQLELEVDTSAIAARGILSILWTVGDALTMMANGPVLVIPSMPPSPGTCDVRVTVSLADGTQCRGHASITAVTSAAADRFQRLCQLTHIISQMPIARVPTDVLINPVRFREIARNTAALPDANRVVVDLQRALEKFARG